MRPEPKVTMEDFVELRIKRLSEIKKPFDRLISNGTLENLSDDSKKNLTYLVSNMQHIEHALEYMRDNCGAELDTKLQAVKNFFFYFSSIFEPHSNCRRDLSLSGLAHYMVKFLDDNKDKFADKDKYQFKNLRAKVAEIDSKFKVTSLHNFSNRVFSQLPIGMGTIADPRVGEVSEEFILPTRQFFSGSVRVKVRIDHGREH